MLNALIGQSAVILESFSIALVVVKDRHIIWANPAMHDLFGYERNELIGQPTRPFFLDQETYEAFGNKIECSIRNNQALKVSIPQKRKDGRIGWYEFNISCIAGHPDMVLGAIIDRTAVRQVQQPIEESEYRYREVIEDQTEIISRFLPNGTLVFVNDVYCRLFGKTRDEILGQRWHPVVHPDDLDYIEARLQDMSPDHPVVTIENRVFAADGTQRWMQFVNRGFYDSNGTLKEIQSVGRDINYLKQIESNLRETTESLQRAQSVAKIGSFSIASDAEAFSMTKETARLFDLDDTGSTTFAEWFSRIYPEDQAKVETAWQAALQGAPYDLTYRIFVQGQIRWIRALAELEFDDQGQLVHGVGTVQDISDLKRIEMALVVAQQNAEKANQSKTRFLAAASHDLRQPLQAILVLLEVLAKSGLDGKQHEIVQQLTYSSRALSDILNQLLDLSRLESKGIQPELDVVCTADLVAMIHDEFSSIAARKPLGFDLFLSRRCPQLLTDPHLLMTLLRNLVGNALKFTRQGRILVAIRRRGARAMIQIWDTGIGIPQEAVDSIFDEYVQINNPERDRSKGVGLGLSIAKRLARLLDTEIHCRSALGKGSVFEFTVPLHAHKPTEPSRIALDDPTGGISQMTGKRILVVEDDADLAKALKLALETQGMQVWHFGSAEAALASPRVQTVDYYLCDYRLPGMNGVQLLDQLQNKAAGRIKALILTGDVTPEVLQRMELSGWPILRKPIQFDYLLMTLMSQH